MLTFQDKLQEACNQHSPQMSIHFSVLNYAPLTPRYFPSLCAYNLALCLIKQTLTTLCLVSLPFLHSFLFQALVLLDPRNN